MVIAAFRRLNHGDPRLSVPAVAVSSLGRDSRQWPAFETDPA